MTTKQRAYLKGLAMTMDPIFQIGKASMWILGGCTHRNGKDSLASFQPIQTLGGKSGRKHDTGIHPQIGSHGTSRTYV